MHLMIISTNYSLLHPKFHQTHNLLVNKHTTLWGVTFDFFPMKRHLKSWNPEHKFPHDLLKSKSGEDRQTDSQSKI